MPNTLMHKTKTKNTTCAAWWIITKEMWVARRWKHPHQIGRCKFWNSHKGNHKRNIMGRCSKGLECPYDGRRDYTELQLDYEKKARNPTLYPNQYEVGGSG